MPAAMRCGRPAWNAIDRLEEGTPRRKRGPRSRRAGVRPSGPRPRPPERRARRSARAPFRPRRSASAAASAAATAAVPRARRSRCAGRDPRARIRARRAASAGTSNPSASAGSAGEGSGAPPPSGPRTRPGTRVSLRRLRDLRRLRRRRGEGRGRGENRSRRAGGVEDDRLHHHDTDGDDHGAQREEDHDRPLLRPDRIARLGPSRDTTRASGSAAASLSRTRASR